ncbi:MAG: alpha-rhamnosidase, partial [Prevotellaceae bacterium]|nr:alpha-rhamnosidase [Prevotellaceae bacterium]
ETALYGSGSQIDLAYPMLVGVTPPELKQAVTEKLFYETQVRQTGHIGCGLVGVPVVTGWAVNNNQPDFLYGMLKKRDIPSYLYMIDNGGTTTWEYWKGSRSYIHNCYNGIGSWFYQGIGGIRPDDSFSGYRRTWIQPQIPNGVTWAKTKVQTPYGFISVDWKLTNGQTEMNVNLPVGCTARVPAGEKIITLESGKHRIKLN